MADENCPRSKRPKTDKFGRTDASEKLYDFLGSINDEKLKPETKKSLTLEDEKLTAKEYMKNLSKIVKSTASTSDPRLEVPLTELHNLPSKVNDFQPESHAVEIAPASGTENDEKVNQSNLSDGDHFMDVDFCDDFLLDDKIDPVEKSEHEITGAQFISEWETTIQEGTSQNPEIVVHINADELPYTTDKNKQQVFRFFWWDAYEDYFKQPGTVFLFGKIYVKSAESYASCCIAVRNIQRKIYLLPRPFHMKYDLETETNNPVDLLDVYNEFKNKISERLKIKKFRFVVVKRNVFDPEIPEKSDYLEIRYSALDYSLDPSTVGQTFSKVFGTQTSYLEILLLDRKIKGPCWLDIVNPILVKNKYSYCKFEVNCNSPANLNICQEFQNMEPPPLKVLSLNFRTVISPNTKMNEIVMISCLAYNYCVSKKPPKNPFESHFCVFTKPSDCNFPTDLYSELEKYEATKVQKCDSEKALLNYFVTQFEKIDPDLIIGHDLIDYYFGLICSRIEVTKFNGWSRFGKLKRVIRPKKTKPTKIKELMVGRLVCDLKISAKELVKLRSYDLGTLFEEVLNVKKERLTVNDVKKMFSSSASILKLISLTMEDTLNITKIIYDLNAIPLALQITNIAGNVMSKTLLGGRAERNEFLLLHAFTERDYIAPDKSYSKKEEEDMPKASSYSGGLVLEPKAGFYNTLILLMDFNSLYPSIIQEYNICFTTIPANEIEKEMPDTGNIPGILPTEIRKVVESRREVKKLMDNPDLSQDLHMQYNIKQMALKLTANSMYGCLGFSNSRFYAKHLASLVTAKGREILMHTKNLVEGMSLDVIYGDTDSLMINTNTTDYDQVMKIGHDIKKAVNENYKQLELEIDGVYRYTLLLKKKKYAAVTMTKNKSGELIFKKEYKGLDFVRRDWCPLTAHVGRLILDHILSDQTLDNKIENIKTNLTQVMNDLKDDKVPYPLLVITKELSKDPTLYNDKNILSHVSVALRYNSKGGKPLLQGDAVPYVICEDGTSNNAAKRAYHIEELKRSNDLKIDLNYYLSMQIHPVVSRLCEPLEDLDSCQIASMLGMDPKAFEPNQIIKLENKASASTDFHKDEFLRVDPFTYKCPICQEMNTVKPPTAENISLSRCVNTSCNFKPADHVDYISNWLHIQVRNLSKKYYCQEMICEDPVCPNKTNRFPVKFIESDPVCIVCNKGLMRSQFDEKDMYIQLKYYKHIFDLDKLEKKPHLDDNVLNAYKYLKEKASKYLCHSGYSLVNLQNAFGNIGLTGIQW